MVRQRFLLAAAFAATVACSLKGQVVWIGGFPDFSSNTASNWVGGTLPLGDGTEMLEFTDVSSSSFILNSNWAFNQVFVTSVVEDNANPKIVGSGTLTIGAGGIVVANDGDVLNTLEISTPVALSAAQTWDSAVDSQIIINGALTGSAALTLDTINSTETFEFNGASTMFTGPINVAGSYATVIVSNGSALGTGPVTLGDNTTLAVNTGSPIALGNALTLGNDTADGPTVTFGGQTNLSNPFATNLTLAGPVTLFEPDLVINIGQNTGLTITGGITGSEAVLAFDTPSETNANAIVDLQGAFTGITALTLDDGVSVILDGPDTSQSTNLTALVTNGSSYLGLGPAYVGNVANFFALIGSTEGQGSFQGSIGFDGGAMINETIDLTNFTNPNFVGLGSATTATIGPDAFIIPVGGDTAGGNMNNTPSAYQFGGGGGTLTVQTALSDGSFYVNVDDNGTVPNALSLTAGNAPLTLVLSGDLSYSGGTYVDGAVLIFNTPLPNFGSLYVGQGGFFEGGSTNTGYIGVTALSNYGPGSAQDFIALFSPDSTRGVIGFDVIGGGPNVIPDNISLIGLGTNVFLGTATSVQYTGTITPASGESGGAYNFAGVKGGAVTVESSLADYGGPSTVTIGLPEPLESFNLALGYPSVSSVTLSGDNSYSGGTILNSGILYVTNSSSLGNFSSVLQVPEPPEDSGRTGWAATLATSGAPVAIPNAIEISFAGLALNSGSGNLLSLTGQISDLVDQGPGELGVFGPVDISGNNTYTGGTIVSNAALEVDSDSGLGTGTVQATGSTLIFTSTAPMLSNLKLTSSTATFDGSPILDYLQMEASTINFEGATAFVDGVKGDDATSGNVINLGTGTQLTLSTDDDVDGSFDFNGAINGSAGSSVLLTGEGSINLHGASTYGGGTTIDVDTAAIASNNAAFGTGPVNLGTGSVVATNLGVTLTNPIVFGESSSAGLAGFGTFSPGGTLDFANGNGVDPGRALISAGSGGSYLPVPGALTIGGGTSVTFDVEGTYVFAMSDATGAAGSGYGTLNMPGETLTISATSMDPFVIVMLSFDPATAMAGMAQNFNSSTGYTWTLVSAGNIVGFTAGAFVVDFAGFQNSIGTGGFSVSQVGNDLELNFSPVPEPSTWLMMAGGLATLGAACRRRRG